MPDALAERYVHAVTRRLPGDTRDDVARELRGTIADMVDARGDSSPVTVRDVLLELGDPAELAEGYRGRPRYLIGPGYYEHWFTVTRTVLAVAVPTLFALQLIGGFVDEDRSGIAVVAGAVGGTISVGFQVVFWTTLVFALLERSGVPTASDDEGWDPDDLPEVPAAAEQHFSLAEMIWGIAVLAAIPAALLWQRFRSPFGGDEPTPLFEPGLWNAWFPVLFALVAVMIAFEVRKYLAQRWTAPLVAANVALNLLFLGWAAALFATEDVWNPAFLAAIEEQTDISIDVGISTAITLAVIAVITSWDSIESVISYLRSRRSS